jgi:hypothetical protein
MKNRIYRIARLVDNDEPMRITVDVIVNEGHFHVRETFVYASTARDRHGNDHSRTSRTVTDLGVHDNAYDAMRAADDWFRFNNA